ncbi:MAG: DUF7178 family protein, partial [Tepidisphaeraceae bacterium]
MVSVSVTRRSRQRICRTREATMDRNSTDARRLVRSIRKWYNKATAREREQGASWYDTARADCRQLAAEFSTSPARAAAIVAVLSPMVRWERTLADARRVLRAALQPTPDTPASAPMGLGTTAFPANVRKAWDLALLDVAP